MRKLPITEERLLEIFEENFQRLKLENGHSLSEDVKEAAKQQVLMYWRKLNELALSVTDTEVPLTLPNLITAKKRKYSIEGVVDIVRESDKVIMYDIKTHEADYVRGNIELYQPQLDVYAYIWENLRNEKVSETSIIATRLPKDLIRALLNEDAKSIEENSTLWDPVVKIEHNTANVQQTINSFSETVDLIEDHEFHPPDKERLGRGKNSKWEREKGENTFATDVCRNCDARFSCGSYRAYAKENKSTNWAKFADFYDFEPDEIEQNERVEAYVSLEENLDDMLEDLS